MKSNNFKAFTVETGEEVLIMKSASPEGEPSLVTTIFLGDSIGVAMYFKTFDHGVMGKEERQRHYDLFSQDAAQDLFNEAKEEAGEGCDCPVCVAARDEEKKEVVSKIIH